MLRVYGQQRYYIESLPLHKSQEVVSRGKGYIDLKLTLLPEYEFQRAVLALGPEAGVLSPAWLRDELRWLAEETAKRYGGSAARNDALSAKSEESRVKSEKLLKSEAFRARVKEEIERE